MRLSFSSPKRSVLLAAGVIAAIIIGASIPLGFTGTYEQPSWMPQGSGIDIPSPESYRFSPEMVIITSDTLEATLAPLAAWKTQKGTPCIINTTTEITAHYAGRDTPEKIRNYLKDLYATTNLKWVLLAGDESTVPPRYVYNDDTVQQQDADAEIGTDYYYKPTDYYYSDLTGDWDADGDGRFGERDANTPAGIGDEIEWIPDVYVGRLPTSNQGSMEDIVNKILTYETNPDNGTWRNKFLLGGALADVPNIKTTYYTDEAYIVQAIVDNYVPSSIDATLRVETSPEYPSPYNNWNNLTGIRFETSFKSGMSLVHFQGHGAYDKFGDYTSSHIFDTDALTGASNVNSLLFAAACSTASYDLYYTLMEYLLFPENQGAIGYIGSMRVTWYFPLASSGSMISLNRGIARLFWQNFFESGTYQPGKVLADAREDYLNSEWFSRYGGSLEKEYERKNLLTYTLFGDPELSVATDQLGAFADPLPTTVYAGQRLRDVINNTSNQQVSSATVCIRSLSGDFYYTSHVTGGIFDVRLALEPQTYNLTITAPNMEPFYMQFTTVDDSIKPEYGVVLVEDAAPVPASTALQYFVDNSFDFSVIATDSHSGVGAVVLHVSYDNFVTQANFSLTRLGYTNSFTAAITDLPPGEMQYYFTIMDYAENEIDVRPSAGGNYGMQINPLAIHYAIIGTTVGASVLFGIGACINVVKKWQGLKNFKTRA